MNKTVHIQLNKNWINHESKRFKYQGFLPSVKDWKIQNFVVRGCFSIF